MDTWVSLAVSVLFTAAIYVLIAQSVQLTVGHTGMFDLGQVGTLLLVAYGTAILTLEVGLPLVVGALVATLFTAAVAAALISVLGELRGDYLALSTLAFAEIVRVTALNSNGLTNGSQGLISYDDGWRRTIGDLRGSVDILQEAPYQLLIALTAWIAAITVGGLMARMQRSPWGLVLAAIRNDDVALRAVGKNVGLYRVQAYLVAVVPLAFLAVFISLDLAFLAPSTFGLDLVVVGLVVAIAAGMRTGWRLMAAAAAYSGLLELTRHVSLGLDDAQAATVRFILMGLALIVAVRITAQRRMSVSARREVSA